MKMQTNSPAHFSVERQMRFLASVKENIAVTTTTPSGTRAMGSIPAAGARFMRSPSADRKENSLNFSYRSMCSPPSLKEISRTHSSNSSGLESVLRRSVFQNSLDVHCNIYCILFIFVSFSSRANESNSKKTLSEQEIRDTEIGLRKPKNSSSKHLDLSILYKSVVIFYGFSY